MRYNVKPIQISQVGKVTEVRCYKRDGTEQMFTLDTDDAHLLGTTSWNINNGYAWSNKHGFLHQLIMGKKDGLVIDHINRNRLDNRRSNLRHTTLGDNSKNQTAKGYSYTDGKYRARFAGKYIGHFDTPDEASKAYWDYRKRMYNHLYKDT